MDHNLNFKENNLRKFSGLFLSFAFIYSIFSSFGFSLINNFLTDGKR